MINLFLNLFSRNKSACRMIDNQGNKPIYDHSVFLKLIELERQRVHRDQQQFSLILINVNQRRKVPIGYLIQKISRRIRQIDQVGWYDRFHLGVLLPNTPPAGAQRIARDICSSRDMLRTPFQFQTLSYPDQNESLKVAT